MILQYEGRLHAHDVLQQTLQGSAGPHPDATDADTGVNEETSREALGERLQHIFRRGNDVEREIVLTARATGQVSPAAADEVLHDIEVRAARTGP